MGGGGGGGGEERQNTGSNAALKEIIFPQSETVEDDPGIKTNTK